MGDVPTTERKGAFIGRVLRGKYRIDRRLGTGGWGSVFEAEHLLLRRAVAIKLLHPDIAAEPKFAERFRREAVTLSRLGHPGIIEVIDIDRTDDGMDFIVLELLRGENLGKRLERRKMLPLPEALAIFDEIADALAAAHAAGIVHRDLKPDNVFLVKRPDGSEHVKLLDFGVAKVAQGPTDVSVSITHTGALLGTPVYMSPEQVRTDRSLDHRTDLYALGVMMYEALAGELPFMSANFAQLVIKILDEPPIPLIVLRGDVPRPLDDLVMRLLAKDPADRPESCEAVLDIVRALRGDAGQARARAARARSPASVDTALAETVELRLVDPDEAVTRVSIPVVTDDEVTRVAPMPTEEDEPTRIGFAFGDETPRVMSPHDLLGALEEPTTAVPVRPLPTGPEASPPKRRARDRDVEDRTTTQVPHAREPERRPQPPARPVRRGAFATIVGALMGRAGSESSAQGTAMWIVACLAAFMTAASVTYFLMTR